MKKCYFLMLLLTVVLLIGCGLSKQQTNHRADTNNILIVGTEPRFAPFEFFDDTSKSVVGFDVDMINAIAKRLKYERCEIVPMVFDNLIPALEAKKVNVVIAGITITEERSKRVNFSQPYYISGLVLVVRKKTDIIKTLEDLSYNLVGVQTGTTSAALAQEIKGALVKKYVSFNEACLALKQGKVEAVVGDLPVVQWFLKKGGSSYCKMVGDVLKEQKFAIATPKSDPGLCKDIDKAIDEMKKDGEYDKIYQKWFGSTSAKKAE